MADRVRQPHHPDIQPSTASSANCVCNQCQSIFHISYVFRWWHMGSFVLEHVNWRRNAERQRGQRTTTGERKTKRREEKKRKEKKRKEKKGKSSAGMESPWQMNKKPPSAMSNVERLEDTNDTYTHTHTHTHTHQITSLEGHPSSTCTCNQDFYLIAELGHCQLTSSQSSANDQVVKLT